MIRRKHANGMRWYDDHLGGPIVWLDGFNFRTLQGVEGHIASVTSIFLVILVYAGCGVHASPRISSKTNFCYFLGHHGARI